MDIAIEFKSEDFKTIIADSLQKRDFSVGESSSIKTIWVGNIKMVSQDGKRLGLEHLETYCTYFIDLNDIEYFEVHTAE